MLLIILFCLLVAIGIICICKSNRELVMTIGGLFSVFSTIAIIVCVAFIMKVQIPREVDYQNTLTQREMLEYRIEKSEEIVGNEMLYSQIVEFNNDLRKTKTYADSMWLNWFANKKISTIDYIDYK